MVVKVIRNPWNKVVAVMLAKTGCRLEETLEIEMDGLMLDAVSFDCASGSLVIEPLWLGALIVWSL